ncbi:MAG: hypothetical protein II688_00315, partial [Lachnospiraceae bacterium]|nr:hypothetical protein [Lachnospiraceae bacterium]
MYRRSYRSRDFGYYSARMLRRLADWIKFSCYDMGVRDMLVADHSGVPGFSDMLALAINWGDKVCIDTVREMILGDNNVLLSRDVIIAVIRSDNEGLKEDLARLLVAAGRQEGLRQAILESADEGDKKTFRLFLKTCMDNDMFRFTAAARALYTWTGLYREEIDIAETRKLAQTAWDCLTNLQKRKECFESENPLDMYLAMWAVGCRDVAETDRLAERLITDEKTYKRLLGWYFVMHVENDTYRHTMAASHLDERDPKVLSLLLPCLHHNYKAVYATTYNRKDYSAECLPDSMLPKTKEGRRALFEKLKAVVQFIGKENYTFDPVLFPWMATVLNNKDGKPLKCMMSLAAVDLDSRMIDELWELSQYMDSDQRRALYILFLSPDKEPKHRRYIYDGLKDKSVSNKEIAIEKLKGCKACEEDVRQICQVLKSKSAVVKKAAVSYLSELDVGLKRFAVKTLAAGGEEELQAAAELVLGDSKLEKEAPQLLAGLAEKTVSTQTEVLLKQLSGGQEDGDITPENGYGLFDKNVIGKTLADIGKKPALDRFLSAQEIDALSIKKDEILRLFEELNAVFERHKDHEYQYCAYDGGTQTAVFGDVPQYSGRIHVPKEHGNEWELRRSGKLRLEMMPFADEFKKALAPWIADGKRLCMLAWVCINSNIGFGGGDTQGWFAPLAGRFGRRASEDLWEHFKGRTAQMTELIELSLKEADQSAVFK